MKKHWKAELGNRLWGSVTQLTAAMCYGNLQFITVAARTQSQLNSTHIDTRYFASIGFNIILQSTSRFVSVICLCHESTAFVFHFSYICYIPSHSSLNAVCCLQSDYLMTSTQLLDSSVHKVFSSIPGSDRDIPPLHHHIRARPGPTYETGTGREHIP